MALYELFFSFNFKLTLKCNEQTSTTTKVVDVDWTVTVINKLDYQQRCWWHRIFLHRRKRADYRGRCKPEPEIPRLVEKRNFA